jgi:hypothetical protein
LARDARFSFALSFLALSFRFASSIPKATVFVKKGPIALPLTYFKWGMTAMDEWTNIERAVDRHEAVIRPPALSLVRAWKLSTWRDFASYALHTAMTK